MTDKRLWAIVLVILFASVVNGQAKKKRPTFNDLVNSNKAVYVKDAYGEVLTWKQPSFRFEREFAAKKLAEIEKIDPWIPVLNTHSPIGFIERANVIEIINRSDVKAIVMVEFIDPSTTTVWKRVEQRRTTVILKGVEIVGALGEVDVNRIFVFKEMVDANPEVKGITPTKATTFKRRKVEIPVFELDPRGDEYLKSIGKFLE